MTPPFSNPPILSTLESYLKLTTTRQQLISANMANIDTPGYKTHDVNFAGELQKAINTVSYTGEQMQMTPAVQQVSGLIERPDGNNVSLDREGLLLSETQLQHQLGVQLIKHQFHNLLSAISGGN
jgi:flagellar basal-body rod protein FlgB